MHPKMRVLLNQAPNGGGGGGTAPAGGQQPPATPGAQPGAPPATPGAQGTPAPQDGDAAPSWFTRERNSMFADMRKMVEGIVSKAGNGQAGAAPTTTTPATGQGTGQPATPLSVNDVQSVIRRERELTLVMAAAPTITASQRARMEEAFQHANPDNVTEWGRAYLADFGLVGTTSAAGASATTTTATGQQQGPPASDGGGQAAPARNFDGASLFTMSEADRAHVIREKGLDWYLKTLREQSRGTTVKLR
jgi:hypothetical protein